MGSSGWGRGGGWPCRVGNDGLGVELNDKHGRRLVQQREQSHAEGAEEVPPVNTSASGGGTITVKDDHSVSGSVTTKGLSGIAAHIHVGARGQNGPVIVPLAKGADGNTWSVAAGAKLTDAQYQAYRAGNLYVNVHTAAHKGGEIRGQIKP